MNINTNPRGDLQLAVNMFRYVTGWLFQSNLIWIAQLMHTDDAPSDESSADLRGNDLWAQEECDSRALYRKQNSCGAPGPTVSQDLATVSSHLVHQAPRYSRQ